jgi:hypothetical protein
LGIASVGQNICPITIARGLTRALEFSSYLPEFDAAGAGVPNRCIQGGYSRLEVTAAQTDHEAHFVARESLL